MIAGDEIEMTETRDAAADLETPTRVAASLACRLVPLGANAEHHVHRLETAVAHANGLPLAAAVIALALEVPRPSTDTRPAVARRATTAATVDKPRIETASAATAETANVTPVAPAAATTAASAHAASALASTTAGTHETAARATAATRDLSETPENRSAAAAFRIRTATSPALLLVMAKTASVTRSATARTETRAGRGVGVGVGTGIVTGRGTGTGTETETETRDGVAADRGVAIVEIVDVDSRGGLQKKLIRWQDPSYLASTSATSNSGAEI